MVLFKRSSIVPCFFLLFLSLAPLSGSAQDSSQSGSYQGRLWAITGNSTQDTSYLYGTIHIKDEKAYRFPDGTKEALRSVDAYAGELNMDSINPFAMRSKLMMKDSTTLQDLLNEKAYKDVKLFFQDSLNMDLKPFERMHPFFILSQIQLRSFSADSAQALDRYFHSFAKKQGKKLIGLERMSEQLGVIQSIPYDSMAQQLVRIARGEISSSGGERSMQEMLDAYVKGKLSTLLRLTKEQKMSENFVQSFLYERNERMADRAAVHLKEQPTFIAVGAAHLPGERGMIELLRDKGFKVFSISDRNGDG